MFCTGKLMETYSPDDGFFAEIDTQYVHLYNLLLGGEECVRLQIDEAVPFRPFIISSMDDRGAISHSNSHGAEPHVCSNLPQCLVKAFPSPGSIPVADAVTELAVSSFK